MELLLKTRSRACCWNTTICSFVSVFYLSSRAFVPLFLFLLWSSPGMLWFWCSCYLRWRPEVMVSGQCFFLPFPFFLVLLSALFFFPVVSLPVFLSPALPVKFSLLCFFVPVSLCFRSPSISFFLSGMWPFFGFYKARECPMFIPRLMIMGVRHVHPCLRESPRPIVIYY